ncbi:hypothetical protein VE04_07851 [Pseudogymnoascus sp. 24MN13]|nr:hypothetical protein VE04_07851 [Pseudogymnoascus sp. 24MN13]
MWGLGAFLGPQEQADQGPNCSNASVDHSTWQVGVQTKDTIDHDAIGQSAALLQGIQDFEIQTGERATAPPAHYDLDLNRNITTSGDRSQIIDASLTIETIKGHQPDSREGMLERVLLQNHSDSLLPISDSGESTKVGVAISALSAYYVPEKCSGVLWIACEIKEQLVLPV